MSSQRAPRSRIYDGAFYARFVDAMLEGVHGFVVDHLPEGQRVLDACCGTGALALRIARTGKHVVGVELSPRHIAYAQRRRLAAPDVGRLEFELGDVAHLPHRRDREFDVATVVLALHEMPLQSRVPVLGELGRVARRVLIVDYSVPQPWNLAGVRNRALELAAGRQHFQDFRDFSRRGGLGALIAAAGLQLECERRIDEQTLTAQLVARRQI